MNKLSDIYKHPGLERDGKKIYIYRLYVTRNVSYISNWKVDGCKKLKERNIVARASLRVSTESISFAKIASRDTKIHAFLSTRTTVRSSSYPEEIFRNNGTVNDAWKQLSCFEFSILNYNDLFLHIFIYFYNTMQEKLFVE